MSVVAVVGVTVVGVAMAGGAVLGVVAAGFGDGRRHEQCQGRDREDGTSASAHDGSPDLLK